MIYISSSCYNEKNIGKLVETYAKNGITNIELSGGTDFYQEMGKDLKNIKQKFGVQYVCHAYFPPPNEHFVVNLASCNDEIYERSINHYLKGIEFLDEIGCKVLSVHAGFLVEVLPEEIGKKVGRKVVYDEHNAYGRFIYAYNLIREKCTARGIELYLENNVLSKINFREFEGINYFMMTDYDSIERLRGMLDFNLLLDLAHLEVSTTALDLNFEEQVFKLGHYAKWIHMSDNNGIIDQHLPLRRESKIMSAYNRFISKSIPVTIESKGSIEQIKESIEVLKGE